MLMNPTTKPVLQRILPALLALGTFAATTQASSHREAPLITKYPKVDGTDLYLFRSYEPGREDFVTIIADYIPFEDPFGGPNFYPFDEKAIYELHIDNNGDMKEDLTFQFQFKNIQQELALDVGNEGDTRSVPVPLINVGPISETNSPNLNLIETYTVNLIRGERRSSKGEKIRNTANNETVFTKPVDNIGVKTIADYESYANQHIYEINIPGNPTNGRMFVGQRKEPFAISVGEAFDLLNIEQIIGGESSEENDLENKNISSLILEVPISCLIPTGNGSETNHVVIGAWTTASTRSKNGFKQVSRLANPLVNEIVIGLPDKDKFNSSEPENDAQFLEYVAYPTFPELVEILFADAGVQAPNLFPRTDLISVFLTGVEGLNQTSGTGEVMRLNTSTPVTPLEQQNPLGVIGGDNAGFPNGRRPGDDVVDIELRVVMGKLLSETNAPSGGLLFTDGVPLNAGMFKSTFPYLNTPLPGAKD